MSHITDITEKNLERRSRDFSQTNRDLEISKERKDLSEDRI